MLKRILFIFSSFIYLTTLAQNDSLFIENIKLYADIIEYKIEDDTKVNMLVSIAGSEFRYGKWKIFHKNGTVESEGEYTINILPIYCGNDVRKKPSYSSVKIGKWLYWTKKGKLKTDLVIPEKPYEGYYRLFDKEKNLLQEGVFKEGNLFTGKKYTYFSSPNVAVSIDIYENGKYLGKKWL